MHRPQASCLSVPITPRAAKFPERKKILYHEDTKGTKKTETSPRRREGHGEIHEIDGRKIYLCFSDFSRRPLRLNGEFFFVFLVPSRLIGFSDFADQAGS